jgi:methionyl aminopeptidase
MIVLKTPEEIEAMRRAGRAAARAALRLQEAVRPGVRTRELARLAEDVLRQEGATPSFKGYQGFPAPICASVNHEVVHGIPGERRLEEGDIVSLDIGAYLGGFHGDTAITVAVGEVDEKVETLLRVTQEALAAGVAAAVEGGYLSDIGHAVEATVAPHGFGIVREFVGHGIGRSMHEDPQVPNYGSRGRGVRLRRGMVLAIEPMINLGEDAVEVLPDGWTVVTRDRSPSAHFEHTVAVGKTPDVLTLP